MWSDRLSTKSRAELVERLRAVLPAPRPDASCQTIDLTEDGEVTAVAEALWPDPNFVWLDHPEMALLGVDPIARLSVRDGNGVVTGPCGRLEVEVCGFDLLEAAFDAWGGPAGARFFGYLGYELGMELEDLRECVRHSADPPDLCLGLYDWRWEHAHGRWQLCGTDAWRGARWGRPSACPGQANRLPHQVTTSQGFEDAVARTVERIRQGELFQVNLCRRLETPLAASEIWPLYRRLRSITPASHGALIRVGPDSAVLSVSPELFLSVRDGQVRSCPIKGTRPRGKTPEEDRALAAELVASEKDRAELAMIVDVTRNDLGRVCRSGSVKVERHAELVTLPTVHHTYSEVSGRLRAECGPAGLLRASFPPASITGAPKIRAMELAALEEGFRRGAAMASIGWISLNGDMELSVAIRTAIAAEDRVWYLAGCGITAESVPQDELAESDAKAAAFRRALELSESDF